MRLRKSKNEKNRQREKCFYIEKLKIYLKYYQLIIEHVKFVKEIITIYSILP